MIKQNFTTKVYPLKQFEGENIVKLPTQEIAKLMM